MDLQALGMKAIHDFDDVRQSPLPQERLKAARKQASAFRERFMDEPPVQFYQSADMVRVPYPTWYAYSGVYTQSTYKFPYIHILNRIFIIQYHDFLGELKTLLFSPSDIEADRETPFFGRRLADGVLVSEESDLLDGVVERPGFEPLHRHEVFGLLRGIHVLPE